MVVKRLAFLLILFLFLAGCGIEDSIEDKYPRADIVYDQNGNESNVYRAFNTSVQSVSNEIRDIEEPQDMAEKDGNVMMLYDDFLVYIYPDINNSDVLIEVSDDDFIEDNYDSDHFHKYGVFKKTKKYYGINNMTSGKYRGYIGESGKYVRNTGGFPSIRFGSMTRGGGPGVGK
ncbi:DUF4247 domain-containing protein [Filobacillus milosensis]|uniref:DUF4247 domain-containing protein n=1 Tax=Filobacillus milosensis TaxID=94137 RepID=A0A4Y8IVK4_9BACI|nr:DUF4247 domain-containing protein [Filobacillus milosensis]TFB25113.1 DUF4247 domain-containing protein [Filobacillus milosensis]